MEIISLVENPSISSWSFYDAPDAFLILVDEQGNEYSLELQNRKKIVSFQKKRINWCNGWYINTKILLKKTPGITVIDDPKVVLKILDTAARILNQKNFPSVKFPEYGQFYISDVNSLKTICNSFEEYSLDLINDKMGSLNENDKEYLKNISLQQLISVLNCFEISDKFIVLEKKYNESKVLHKYNYEYTLNNVDKFDFPNKDAYSSLYQISFIFQVHSDEDLALNDVIDAQLTFDYLNFDNKYVFNYTGVKKAENAEKASSSNISSSDSRCFVITAVTGDVNHPIVNQYRSFRDTYLLKYNLGNYLVIKYYKYSPPIARLITNSKFSRIIFLNLLIKPIYLILKCITKQNK